MDSLRDEISSLNISFNSIVQNLQNATLLLNTKSQCNCILISLITLLVAEAQLTARIEELEEQLKIKVIALQRNALNSKEFEASLQDLTTRLAENENELLEARQTIQQLTCQIKTLEEEGQQKARELAQLMIHKEKYQTVENRISELEILNRDLNTLQADAEKIICDLNVTVAERARDYRILEDKYDRSVQKIKELESESSTLVDEMVSKLKAENSSLHERYQETLKSFEDFRETVAANGTTALSTSPIVDMNFLNEKVTALEKQNLEMASRLQSEISEKETLSTRVHYLEDMLESISQTAINSSDKKLSALELENKQLKVDIEKLQEELKEVRLKMQHSTPDSSALSTVVHPVYDIFGLSENFEGFPKGELAKESRDLSPSSSHELESKSSESNFLKGNKSSSHLSPSAKVIDSSPSQHEGDHMEDHLSSSALVSSKSTKIKPSVSALPDAKAFRAYRKKLQGEISALRKDRQILKKEILEWNAKFERENGREAMKEEKEKLASDLYDRYQDV